MATPGRLNYLLKECSDNFKFNDNIKFLVLDEFDQLLNESIMPDIIDIIKFLPVEKQTLFFSATIDYSLHKDEFFNKLYSGNKPVLVDLTAGDNIQEKTVKELTQVKYILI